MPGDITKHIKENVLQVWVTAGDEGLEGGMSGQSGVTELIAMVLEENITAADIINESLIAAMQEVGSEKLTCVTALGSLWAALRLPGNTPVVSEPRITAPMIFTPLPASNP